MTRPLLSPCERVDGSRFTAGWLAYQYWLLRRRRRAPREIAAALAAATRSR